MPAHWDLPRQARGGEKLPVHHAVPGTAPGARHRPCVWASPGSCRNSSIRTRMSNSTSFACARGTATLVGRDGQAFVAEPVADRRRAAAAANARVALRLAPIYDDHLRRRHREAASLGAPNQRSRPAYGSSRSARKTGTRRVAISLLPNVNSLAGRFGARVLLNGDADAARALGLAGVHWTAQVLAAATSRPRDLLVAASCHTHAEVMHASALDVDFVVLGPVLATPTHAGVTPLGWDRFADAVAGNRVPVFALGGLHRDDLDIAIARGAHGIAMRRHAWPPG